MHASLVSSRGDGESPEIQKLTAWDTCPTLGNRVSLSHLSIRKADRKHVAAAVQKTTFLHDRQQGVSAFAQKLLVHGRERLCVMKYSASFLSEQLQSLTTSLAKVTQSLRRLSQDLKKPDLSAERKVDPHQNWTLALRPVLGG